MEEGCKGQVGVSIFKFPDEEGLRRLWSAACNKDVANNVTKYATVCNIEALKYVAGYVQNKVLKKFPNNFFLQ